MSLLLMQGRLEDMWEILSNCETGKLLFSATFTPLTTITKDSDPSVIFPELCFTILYILLVQQLRVKNVPNLFVLHIGVRRSSLGCGVAHWGAA
jgi:hypothetical protein